MDAGNKKTAMRIKGSGKMAVVGAGGGKNSRVGCQGAPLLVLHAGYSCVSPMVALSKWNI